MKLSQCVVVQLFLYIFYCIALYSLFLLNRKKTRRSVEGREQIIVLLLFHMIKCDFDYRTIQFSKNYLEGIVFENRGIVVFWKINITSFDINTDVLFWFQAQPFLYQKLVTGVLTPSSNNSRYSINNKKQLLIKVKIR